MRTHTRGAVGRGVATALFLSLSLWLAVLLPVLVPVRANAEGSAARAQAQAVLRSVTDAFTPAPRTPGTRLPYRDVGVLLRDLREARPRLSTAERAEADRYLNTSAARAAASSTCTNAFLGAKVIASTHFCVRYTNGNTAQAQATSDTLEYVYSQEVGAMGFRAPLSDGDGRLDVTLSQLGNQGIYGYCTTTSSAAQSPAYCVLDDDFSPAEFGAPAINSLRVTAAHEFFHAIQFAYNADEEAWALEGSAVWAEDEVYPTINDYLQYLRFSPIREPATPIDSNGTFERYGMVVFWKFLAEYVGSRTVVREFWQYADAPAGRSATAAVVAALAAHRRSFAPAFAMFSAWNTLPRGSYRDRSLWPAPAYAATGTLRTAAPRVTTGTITLNHLSSAAVLLDPGARLRPALRLRVSVNGPARSTSPQALVQLRMRTGAVKYFAVPLNAAGDGSRTVQFNRTRVASAVVTLTNASLTRADGQHFVVSARLVR